jgi:hypothetical protein
MFTDAPAEANTVTRPERWIPLLQDCDSEIEIMRVLRDFLSTIPPKDLAEIPAGAGIATFQSVMDLAGIAVSLAREELLFSGDEEARRLLNSVTAVFSAAAGRLAELQSRRLRGAVA